MRDPGFRPQIQRRRRKRRGREEADERREERGKEKKRSLVRGYNILAKRARILLRKDERRESRDLPCATTVPQALISSIISFGDAADRWWVRENERESISGNQPPGLRSAACRRRRRERKYRETPRSNNPVRPHRGHLATLSSIAREN